MTAILGISAFYHDSAAAIVVDGDIVAAAQEERFTRIKHDHRFPAEAIASCLEQAGLSAADLDYVGFYDKPVLKFERLLETYLAFAPAGYASFSAAMPSWLREKLHLPRVIGRKGLKGYRRGIVFTEHHESHAASAFFPSPFEEAAILTLDGVGEWTTTSLGTGRGNQIELTHEVRFPHSLGLLYSAFTYFTGFKVNSGEYKLMGLAPYGEPVYYDTIIEHLIDAEGRRLLSHEHGLLQLLPGPHDDQPAVRPALRGWCANAGRAADPARDGPRGVGPESDRGDHAALRPPRARVDRHVQPVPGGRRGPQLRRQRQAAARRARLSASGSSPRRAMRGARSALRCSSGTSCWATSDRSSAVTASMDPCSDRPSMTNRRSAFLEAREIPHRHIASEDDLCEAVAELIADEKVVGWFQGRMEFGPRALGSRSILGDARSRSMQSMMNLKIKFRESFRPFAPSVLEERSGEYFELGQESPYMLLVADVHPAKRMSGIDEATGLDKLRVIRSEVPAITHVDCSARVQTIDPVRHPRYHKLVSAFERRTGCPVIINTSFNVRGEPIVCSPEHAYRCFMGTNMDALVLGDFLLIKSEQPGGDEVRNDAYLSEFVLD